MEGLSFRVQDFAHWFSMGLGTRRIPVMHFQGASTSRDMDTTERFTKRAYSLLISSRGRSLVLLYNIYHIPIRGVRSLFDSISLEGKTS